MRKGKRSSMGMKKPQFTLVELLVVIAVIAMLASLLMPALQQAREAAKEIACMSNFKQAGVVFMSYASDYPDRFPAPCDTQYYGNPNANADPACDAWYILLGPYCGYPSWTKGKYPSAKKPTIFVCPTVNPATATWGVDGWHGNNYPVALGCAMNCYLPPPYDRTQWIVYPRISHIKTPSSKTLIADSRYLLGLGDYWYFSQPPPTLYCLDSIRHRNGANILYCDGHVAWSPMKVVIQLGLAHKLY